jgi:hypothetical protein
MWASAPLRIPAGCAGVADQPRVLDLTAVAVRSDALRRAAPIVCSATRLGNLW